MTEDEKKELLKQQDEILQTFEEDSKRGALDSVYLVKDFVFFMRFHLAALLDAPRVLARGKSACCEAPVALFASLQSWVCTKCHEKCDAIRHADDVGKCPMCLGVKHF